MRRIADQAIVLSRINYGERDRILTLLTRENGKITTIAKGVRTEKSRLSGGIELLSISDVTFIDGKSDMKTLVSSRLIKHYDLFSGDLTRMRQAFDALKIIKKISEDGSGQEYFQLLLTLFECLGDRSYDPRLVEVWSGLHLLSSSGTAPRIGVFPDDVELFEKFRFDHQAQLFRASKQGDFLVNDLKLLKLLSEHSKPIKLKEPLGREDQLVNFVKLLLKTNL